MDERFPDEFVTWHHKTPVGVKVEEVFGMDSKSGKVWIELARQIFCEQGNPNYRVIGHFNNDAPYLEGYNGRISVTHTTHLLAVAMLPKTPEVNLEEFNPRAAMGIDAESLQRKQVLNIRSKFLSEEELELVPVDNLEANIIAWTSKEALYKAAMTPGLDFTSQIKLIKLPVLYPEPDKIPAPVLGEAIISFPQGENFSMKLFSYVSYGCCVTIAISPKAAKFGK